MHLQGQMACRPSHGGQHLFLAATEVLQQVLLPRLSPASLCRLSICSKGLRSWLRGTPPELWQVLLFMS